MTANGYPSVMAVRDGDAVQPKDQQRKRFGGNNGRNGQNGSYGNGKEHRKDSHRRGGKDRSHDRGGKGANKGGHKGANAKFANPAGKPAPTVTANGLDVQLDPKSLLGISGDLSMASTATTGSDPSGHLRDICMAHVITSLADKTIGNPALMLQRLLDFSPADYDDLLLALAESGCSYVDILAAYIHNLRVVAADQPAHRGGGAASGNGSNGSGATPDALAGGITDKFNELLSEITKASHTSGAAGVGGGAAAPPPPHSRRGSGGSGTGPNAHGKGGGRQQQQQQGNRAATPDRRNGRNGERRERSGSAGGHRTASPAPAAAAAAAQQQQQHKAEQQQPPSGAAPAPRSMQGRPPHPPLPQQHHQQHHHHHQAPLPPQAPPQQQLTPRQYGERADAPQQQQHHQQHAEQQHQQLQSQMSGDLQHQQHQQAASELHQQRQYDMLSPRTSAAPATAHTPAAHLQQQQQLYLASLTATANAAMHDMHAGLLHPGMVADRAPPLSAQSSSKQLRTYWSENLEDASRAALPPARADSLQSQTSHHLQPHHSSHLQPHHSAHHPLQSHDSYGPPPPQQQQHDGYQQQYHAPLSHAPVPEEGPAPPPASDDNGGGFHHPSSATAQYMAELQAAALHLMPMQGGGQQQQQQHPQHPQVVLLPNGMPILSHGAPSGGGPPDMSVLQLSGDPYGTAALGLSQMSSMLSVGSSHAVQGLPSFHSEPLQWSTIWQ